MREPHILGTPTPKKVLTMWTSVLKRRTVRVSSLFQNLSTEVSDWAFLPLRAQRLNKFKIALRVENFKRD